MAINFSSGTLAGATKVLQVQRYNIPRQSVAVPSYGNNIGNYRQIGSLSFDITPVAANSKFVLDLNILMYGINSHGYITVKRGSTWLHTDYQSSVDGLFANHNDSVTTYWNAGFRWLDSPNQANTSTITYTPWVGMWNATTIYIGSYAANGNAECDGQFLITEIAA